jgi:hypothetical protein
MQLRCTVDSKRQLTASEQSTRHTMGSREITGSMMILLGGCVDRFLIDHSIAVGAAMGKICNNTA